MTTISEKTYVVKISVDDSPEDPRRDIGGSLGTFWTWESRYRSPDEHTRKTPRDGMEDILLSCMPETRLVSSLDIWDDAKLRKEAEKYAIILDVYKYEHSGVAYSTGPFSCQWDSGQVGWIWVSKTDVKREYSVSVISKKVREKAIAVLEAEVETWSQYANGDVFYVSIEDENEDVLESLGGIYGHDEAEKQANELLIGLLKS